MTMDKELNENLEKMQCCVMKEETKQSYTNHNGGLMLQCGCQ